MRNRVCVLFVCALFLTGMAVPLLAGEYSWQQPHARVLPTGDLEWAPKPFVFKKGASVRYIDYEGGDDRNTGESPQAPWKHHPWDVAATGKAKACTGIHTYVFKRGVIYRGRMIANESGKPDNPIRLTSDPDWGTGEAVISGAKRVTGWKQGADHKDLPDTDKVWFADVDFAPRCLWMVREDEEVIRIALARTPNWTVSDPRDIKSEWWAWKIDEWWKDKHKTKSPSGMTIHFPTDKEQINREPDYYRDAIVWTEFAICMGTPYATRVEVVDTDKGALGVQGPYYGHSMRIWNNNRYYLEDKPHYLDAPGEFWFDRKGKGGRLYVRLPRDADPNSTVLEAGKTTTIIDSQGMSHVTFSGLTFRFSNVHWDYHERFWKHKEVDCACIRLIGSGTNLRVTNCRFEHVAKAVRFHAAGKQDRVDEVVITDNEMRHLDHGAVSLACGGGYGTIDPPVGLLGRIRVLRNRLHRIGLRPIRFGHGHAIGISSPETAEIAGNILTRCYGSGLFVFGGKGGARATDVPLSRVLMHHNKVVESLLNSNDWGGIEFWQIGPAYLYSNISGDPGGYWNWKWATSKPAFGARLGMAYYLDGGFKGYVFNNIAWGRNNDPKSKYCNKTAFNEAGIPILNSYFNNTAYKFAVGHNYNPNGGRHKFLGNLWVDIAQIVFQHGKRYDDKEEHTRDYPYDAIAFARNIFHEITGDLGHFEWNGKSYAKPEAFRAALEERKALQSDFGQVAEAMPLQAPEKHDFRPKAGSAAIDQGVRHFVPWGLFRTVGEWQFHQNHTDPTVVQDEHFYAAPYYAKRHDYHKKPDFPLTAKGITAESFVAGPLEDWTESALKLNGTDQYLVCSNDLLVQEHVYEVGRNKAKKRTAAGRDFYSPAVRDSSFLLEFHLRLDRPDAAGVLLQKMGDAAGISLVVQQGGKLCLQLKATGKEATAESRAALNDGKWHHVIVECDRPAGEIRFYLDGRPTGSAPGLAAGPSLYAPADLFLGGTPEGECLAVTLDFARVSLGTLADAKTTIEELYALQFAGPQYRDFCGNEIQRERRDAGAVEHVE